MKNVITETVVFPWAYGSWTLILREESYNVPHSVYILQILIRLSTKPSVSGKMYLIVYITTLRRKLGIFYLTQSIMLAKKRRY
jgi:hypothetical protein